MKTKKIHHLLLLPLLIIASAFLFESCNNCGDLIINKITITQINGNKFDYDVEFKNIGQGPINIDGNNTHPNIPGFQTYLSVDAVLDNLDPPAGGTTIAGGPTFSLTTNQTYIRSSHYVPSDPLPIASYPYLIIVIKPENSNDCNTTNNTAVKRIL